MRNRSLNIAVAAGIATAMTPCASGHAGHPGHGGHAEDLALAAAADALADFGIFPGTATEARTATAFTSQPSQERQGRRPAPMEAMDLPASRVTIAIEGDARVITANGLPAHETGAFPNRGNPNALRPQEHEFRLPLAPTIADEPTPARPEFGVALNGVIFDAGTGEFWVEGRGRAFGGGSAWNYEALGGGVPLGLDGNNAHVQPTGKYHYHGIPTGLIESLADNDGDQRPILIGWAYDGFPIYGPHGFSDPADPDSVVKELKPSYQLKPGERPGSPEGPGGAHDGTFGADYEYVEGSGDLDECNGRFGVTPEFPMGTYYYVITEAYPNVPRMWRGEPAAGGRRGADREGPDRAGDAGHRRPEQPGPRGREPRERPARSR